MGIVKAAVIFYFVGVSKGGSNKNIELESSEFKDVVESAAFVDKTMLIRTWLSHEIVAVTAPRRFGKSTNMDMVKCFCEMPVDARGEPLDPRSTANYRLFSENNLNLYRLERELFDEHVGTYPIIHLDFECLNGSDYKAFMSSFRTLITKLYEGYRYLLKSRKLDDYDKKLFERFVDFGEITKSNEIELQTSATILCELLHQHFGRKCVVLINELDAVIQDAVIHSGSDTRRIIIFIRHFITHLLKTNQHLKKSLVHACLWPALVSWSAVSNKDLFDFTKQHDFSLFYGLTEQEVIDLFNKFKIPNDLSTVRSWYGGYRILGDEDLSVYNVHSVVRYLCSKELKNYWAQTEYFNNLGKLFLKKEIREYIQTIVDGGTVAVHNRTTEITEDEVVSLIELVNNVKHCTLEDTDVQVFLQFMLALGYLTVCKDCSEHELFVRVPNREVKDKLQCYL